MTEKRERVGSGKKLRVSANPGDPGFRRDLIGVGVRVLVDGRELTHCVTADEIEGFAVCYDSRDGHPFIDPDNPDRPKESTFRGDVRIILPDRFIGLRR